MNSEKSLKSAWQTQFQYGYYGHGESYVQRAYPDKPVISAKWTYKIAKVNPELVFGNN
jgi:hypothetical protein